MHAVIEWLVRVFAWVFRRPRLRVRIIEDDRDASVGGLQFEAENTSPSATSLDPMVRASFMYPSGGQYRRGRAIFDVRDLDRELPPFKPKLFSASARELPSGYGFSWFRSYRFKPRRGVARRVRLRNAALEPLSPLRFWAELLRFRLGGSVKKTGPTTQSEHEARRRSRGPH